MGDGQREEDRWSLSFNAWIAIAVGLLVMIVLGLHVPVYLTYRHEQKVVAEVVRLGGWVDAERHAPPWPLSVFADRWEPYGRLFDGVVGATVRSTATDASLVHLAGQTELLHLHLSYTQVTDAGLAHLAGLTKLVGLGLDNTQVTDAGFAHLAGLTNLSDLLLRNTQVTDAGVAELKRKLPDLTTVKRKRSPPSRALQWL